MAIATSTAMLIAAGVSIAASSAQAGWSATHKPNMPEIKLPEGVKPDEVVENEGQKEREKRRRSYAGMGRSSTILTQNLGAIGEKDDRPKQLLGM